MPSRTQELANAQSSTIASDLPVLDYQKFNGTESNHRQALKELDDAFKTFGFVYLANHSIPQSMVDEAFEWSKRFFDLPHEIKKTAAHPASSEWDDHRGFAEEGLGHVSQLVWDAEKVQELRRTAHERKETFEMGSPDESQGGAPNRWLEDKYLPGWRTFIEKWWEECTKLERSILHFLGQVLQLEDEELLCNRQSRNLCHMSWAFYPEMPIAPLKNKQLRRLNAHTDFGSLTLLFQDLVGGLEIHDGNVFRPVIPKRGTVVLNVGDMLERQSNGRWKSGLHQVVAPSQAHLEKGFELGSSETVVDRYAIIYFGQPDPESLVDTLPGCEERGKWKPNMVGEWEETMTAREWLQKRLAFEY